MNALQPVRMPNAVLWVAIYSLCHDDSRRPEPDIRAHFHYLD